MAPTPYLVFSIQMFSYNDVNVQAPLLPCPCQGGWKPSLKERRLLRLELCFRDWNRRLDTATKNLSDSNINILKQTTTNSSTTKLYIQTAQTKASQTKASSIVPQMEVFKLEVPPLPEQSLLPLVYLVS